MRIVLVVAMALMACAGCRGEAPSGIDDVESTLNSIEADLDQP